MTVLADATPPGPTITGVQQEGRPANTILLRTGTVMEIHGTNLNLQAGDEIWMALYDEGGGRR